LGYLLVGPRPDGSIPSKEEQKALSNVSETIARAIRTVIKREQHEAEVTRLIDNTNRRIDEIEALLGAGSPAPRRRSPGTG
jgi:NAD-specific glutamate dehydrogenase